MAPASLWSPALPPALGSFLFVVVAFYAVSTGLLFRWRRDVRLQSRDVNFLILGSIFLCVRDIVVLLNIALLEFPCGWAIWIALIGEIGVDTSIMARAARFLFKTLTSEFKENYLDWLVGGRLSQSPHELTTAKQKLKILIIRCRMLFSNLAMIIHVVTILIVTVIVQSILASYSWMQSTPDQFCLGGVNHLMLYPRIVITVLYVFIIFPLVGGVLIAFECDHPLKTELFLIMACITLGETVVNFLSFWLVPNYPSVAVYIRPGLGIDPLIPTRS
ncbi:uncharacterized protein BJ171DRAFT_570084 [Polychytrium aggregatum]|uniref:uncharacterized protein n=1 Tax=Polychytrium aggregatum TaxID=110093 RepID=UPI0022FEA7F9|nr:uncharacterized protein BJ171DRAFT_570084 [Polychytrium aggregatum]KAI9201826.1 hypothetical protein BJ171DRAFT_570084 [Polychytrium aggregatum]